MNHGIDFYEALTTLETFMRMLGTSNVYEFGFAICGILYGVWICVYLLVCAAHHAWAYIDEDEGLIDWYHRYSGRRGWLLAFTCKISPFTPTDGFEVSFWWVCWGAVLHLGGYVLFAFMYATWPFSWWLVIVFGGVLLARPLRRAVKHRADKRLHVEDAQDLQQQVRVLTQRLEEMQEGRSTSVSTRV